MKNHFTLGCILVSMLVASGFGLERQADAGGDEISRRRIFDEPLVSLGTAPPEENQALSSALGRMAGRESNDNMEALEKYLGDFPHSPWNASLYCNLGQVYYKTGFFSKALSSLEEAWRLSKGNTDAHGSALGDRSLGELLKMNARLGRFDRLSRLLKEAKGRNVRGSATEKWQGAKEALWLMNHEPEVSFRCGPLALSRILALSREGDKQQAKILASKSTRQGVSLWNVYKLSGEVGLNLRVAKRTRNTALPLPAVVHWKVGHYAAILEKVRGRYHVQDPTFGGDLWISQTALDAEASGYFLVPNGNLSEGWVPVTREEASTVWGKGITSSSEPGHNSAADNTTGGNGCDKEKGGEKGGPTPPQKGMPTYRFHTMLASLNIMDVPLGYAPPRGPAVDFRITYSQREASQPMTFNYSNLGNKWTLDWISYITDDPMSPLEDAELFVQGGGSKPYVDFDTVTSSYAPQFESRAVLARVSSSPIRYERRLPDGSKEIFDVSNGATSFPRKVFLSEIVDPQGQSITFAFDAAMRLTTVTDALGQVTTLAYELPGDTLKVTKVTDPFGRFATLTYNGDGQLESITDVADMTSEFTYGANDFIHAMTTPYGTTTFKSGDGPSATRWIEAKDPLGQKERLEFRHSNDYILEEGPYPDGMLAADNLYHEANSIYWDKKAMAQAPGDVKSGVIYQWLRALNLTSSSNIVASVKKPLERRVFYNYPNQYLPISIASNMVGKWNRSGRYMDDSSSQVHQYEYNDLGLVTKYTDPLGRITAYRYDSNQIDLVSVRQQTGTVDDLLDTLTYNPLHLPSTIKDPSGLATVFTYNPNGQLLTSTDAKGEVTTRTYDGDGYLIRITGPIAGDTTKFSYDGFGRVRTITRSDGYTVANEYDALDRLTKVRYADSTYEEFVYNKLDLERSRDRRGRWTKTFFNSLRQLSAVQDPSGRTTNLEWCSCGNLATLIDPMGKSTSWKRDVQGRVTEKVHADGKKIQYAYEPFAGRLKSTTDALGQTKNFQYFKDDNIKQISYSDAVSATPTVHYTFDSTYNRLLAMTDGQGTSSYGYYPIPGTPFLGAGRLKSIDGPWSNDSILFAYDSLGRVSTLSIDGRTASYAYDILGRTSSTTDALGTFTYKYVGATGRLDSLIYPNGQKTKYGYFSSTGDFRLQEIKNLTPSLAWLSKSAYTYDAEGQILSWTRQSDSALAEVHDFSYDPVDQVIGDVVRSAGGGNPILKNFAFAYDKSGNRLSSVEDSTVNGFTYNNLNQATSQQPGGLIRYNGSLDEAGTVEVNGQPVPVSAAHAYNGYVFKSNGVDTVTVAATDYSNNGKTNRYRLNVSGASKTFTYDDNGNLVDDGTSTYEWDAENRLVAIAKGTLRSEFAYDGLGRRVEIVEKTSGTIDSKIKLLWVGNTIEEERDSTGGTVGKEYSSYGADVAGAKYFYTKDHLGSIREMTDSAGTIVARYVYDPFGKRIRVSGSLDADFGFTGHYLHAASELYLTKYRAYSPGLGRWISRDPIGEKDGPNLYAYVANSPINWTDPLGLTKTDKWYGCNDRDFQDWYHKEWKHGKGPNAGKDEMKDAWDKWDKEGRPKRDKSKWKPKGGYDDPGLPEPSAEPDATNTSNAGEEPGTTPSTSNSQPSPVPPGLPAFPEAPVPDMPLPVRIPIPRLPMPRIPIVIP
ncbi:MAG TPA: RHS repeat-associated core domain-containing protein [Fibrobacteria bacterium]|nr:RHS repeat-associated core domain-containing protein [Fibrobacteria bacterium]